MKGKRFIEELIIEALKAAKARAKTKDLCRKYAIDATFYNWKAKYGGDGVKSPAITRA